MAATRASGTNAVRYGTMKDNVLALKVVLADGEVMTHRAARARKSSAGYDLTRLMVGSEGTLGVITELTLRLVRHSRSDRRRRLSVPFGRGRCKATILTIQPGIPVARIELLDALQVRAVQSLFEAGLPETPMLFVEFHGSEARRRRAVAALRRHRRRNSAAGRSTGRPRPRTAPGCGRRATTRYWRRSAAAGRAGRSRPMSACRSRGSPNA